MLNYFGLQWPTQLLVVDSDVDAVVTVVVDVVALVEVPARMRRKSGESQRKEQCQFGRCSKQCAIRMPVTKLGRLVKDGKIRSIEEIYLFSMPVKEYQIIDLLLPKLKGELVTIIDRTAADT